MDTRGRRTRLANNKPAKSTCTVKLLCFHLRSTTSSCYARINTCSKQFRKKTLGKQTNSICLQTYIKELFARKHRVMQICVTENDYISHLHRFSIIYSWLKVLLLLITFDNLQKFTIYTNYSHAIIHCSICTYNDIHTRHCSQQVNFSTLNNNRNKTHHVKVSMQI